MIRFFLLILLFVSSQARSNPVELKALPKKTHESRVELLRKSAIGLCLLVMGYSARQIYIIRINRKKKVKPASTRESLDLSRENSDLSREKSDLLTLAVHSIALNILLLESRNEPPPQTDEKK